MVGKAGIRVATNDFDELMKQISKEARTEHERAELDELNAQLELAVELFERRRELGLSQAPVKPQNGS